MESYLLLPLVQQWTVEMPPALTIAAIVLLGVLFGGLGIALAAPLAAAGMVVVNMLTSRISSGRRTETRRCDASREMPRMPDSRRGWLKPAIWIVGPALLNWMAEQAMAITAAIRGCGRSVAS
ncbi:MAG: hypothetical protein ACREDZ_05490 [Kiloniellales bacterium]